MKNYGKKELMTTKYGLVYELYGIYVDWQIDHDIFPQLGVRDPNGIEKFEDFYAKCSWQVAKVRVAGAERLMVDIDLAYFSYCGRTGLKITVLEDKIAGGEILKRLVDWSKITGLAPLEQLKYYLNLVAVETYGKSGQIVIVCNDKSTQ